MTLLMYRAVTDLPPQPAVVLRTEVPDFLEEDWLKEHKEAMKEPEARPVLQPEPWQVRSETSLE